MSPISLLIKKSWRTYADCWQTLFFLSAITVLADKVWGITVMPAIASLFGLGELTSNDPVVVASTGTLGLLIILLSWIVVFVIGIWGSAAQIIAIHTHTRRKHPLIRELYEHAKPMLFPLTVASILASISIGIGLILLLVPGMILLFLFQFIPFVTVVEKKTGRAIFSRSIELATYHVWPLLVRNAVLLLILAVITSLVEKPLFLNMVAQALVLPFILVYQYTVYKEVSAHH